MIKSTILIFIVALFSASLFGQTTESVAITAAIKAGNAQEISKYFSGNIDLTLLSVEDVYSKQQAEVILTKFFAEHSPTEFSVKHDGKSKMDDYFYIGDLLTEKGDYRITFFLKNESGAYRIRQLRIEN